MAYVIDAKTHELPAGTLPLHFETRAGRALRVERYDAGAHEGTVQRILNQVIAEGISYPQEAELSVEQFRAYYTSHDAFVSIDVESGEVVGSVYIKPNFPGRCSHICNGGFLVDKAQRGKGIGHALAAAFLQLAPLCGYRAAMFNLVFVNNESSLRLWRSAGFTEIGRIPEAGRLASGEYVDAIQFYKKF